MSFDFDCVPVEQRCYQFRSASFWNRALADCFFGVPPDSLYGRHPLTSIPSGATGFHFYCGADQHALIDSFIESDLAESTTSLHVGSSCFDFGNGLDYRGLTASLMQADFPRLETLELGVWQLFSNSHCVYGRVGNIDTLGTRMPALKHLYLYGHCELRTRLSLPHLETLHVVVDDPAAGINGGPLDSLTVSNILSSSFPNLRKLFVDLEIDEDDVSYSVPDVMMTDDVFPRLTAFELVGNFHAGERQRLMNSAMLRNKHIKLHLDEMVDVP